MPRRGPKRKPPISLFAFQDIITSVTGIMILVTLLLAVEVLERLDASPKVQTERQVKVVDRTLADIRREIERLKAELQQAVKRLEDLPSLDQSTLEQLAAGIDADSRRLRQKIIALRHQLTAKQQEAAQRQRESDKRARAEKEQLAKLNKEAAIQEQKLDKIARTDRTFFTTGVVGKKTWIVEISARGFMVAQIGVRTAPRNFQSVTSIGQWIQSLDSTSNAIYLVVKPSGVTSFKKTRDLVEAAKLDYGLQVAAEGKQFIDPQNGASPP